MIFTRNRILDKAYHYLPLWSYIPYLFHKYFSNFFPSHQRVKIKCPETVLFSAIRTLDRSALRRLQVLKFHCLQETNVIIWSQCSFPFLRYAVFCIMSVRNSFSGTDFWILKPQGTVLMRNCQDLHKNSKCNQTYIILWTTQWSALQKNY